MRLSIWREMRLRMRLKIHGEQVGLGAFAGHPFAGHPFAEHPSPEHPFAEHPSVMHRKGV
jgi:hypothetical protein